MKRPAQARICTALIALAFAGQAAADARADLHAAFQKNLSAKTYRATMTDLATGKQFSTVEFQAPDRYRVQANGMTSVIANGNMYVAVNGKPMTIPMPAGTLDKFRSDAAWKQMELDTQIQDSGAGVVGTEPAHKFHWVNSGKHPSTGDAWVSSKSGYVIQIVSMQSKKGAVRVQYGDFNSSAISISPPK
jgi:outer membrane lipoprotein-sorting protein